jgi:hypothetical protein
MSESHDLIDELDESEQVVLSDLINRVLDKGVVISSNIMISIADIDLIQLDLRLLISSVAALSKRPTEKGIKKFGNLPLRPPSRP